MVAQTQSHGYVKVLVHLLISFMSDQNEMNPVMEASTPQSRLGRSITNLQILQVAPHGSTTPIARLRVT